MITMQDIIEGHLVDGDLEDIHEVSGSMLKACHADLGDREVHVVVIAHILARTVSQICLNIGQNVLDDHKDVDRAKDIAHEIAAAIGPMVHAYIKSAERNTVN